LPVADVKRIFYGKGVVKNKIEFLSGKTNTPVS
jgi:hypothetical protein